MALGDFLGSGDASHASRSSIDLKLDFDCQLNRLQLLDETCGICTSGQDRQIMWSLQSPLGKKSYDFITWSWRQCALSEKKGTLKPRRLGLPEGDSSFQLHHISCWLLWT